MRFSHSGINLACQVWSVVAPTELFATTRFGCRPRALYLGFWERKFVLQRNYGYNSGESFLFRRMVETVCTIPYHDINVLRLNLHVEWWRHLYMASTSIQQPNVFKTSSTCMQCTLRQISPTCLCGIFVEICDQFACGCALPWQCLLRRKVVGTVENRGQSTDCEFLNAQFSKCESTDCTEKQYIALVVPFCAFAHSLSKETSRHQFLVEFCFEQETEQPRTGVRNHLAYEVTTSTQLYSREYQKGWSYCTHRAIMLFVTVYTSLISLYVLQYRQEKTSRHVVGMFLTHVVLGISLKYFIFTFVSILFTI